MFGGRLAKLIFRKENILTLFETAVVICDQNIKEYLINYARPLIFSTSMPLSNVHMLRIIHNLLASGGFDNVSWCIFNNNLLN